MKDIPAAVTTASSTVFLLLVHCREFMTFTIIKKNVIPQKNGFRFFLFIWAKHWIHDLYTYM